MGLMIFNNISEYNKFFGSIPKNVVENIEYKAFKNFNKNRLLILAEHAFTERINIPEFGKGTYIGVGDKNTDLLAKMAAFFLQSAYIVPWVSRYKIDFARDPKLIGKNNKLLVVVHNTEPLKKRYISIHNDNSYLPVLLKYISMIKEFNPRFILSCHGMDKRHSMDITIGAGPNFSYLGGKIKAMAFVDYVKKRVNEEIKQLGFKSPLEITLSPWLFAGNKNHTLASYAKKGVICCQVEFNLRGRTSDKLGMPKRKFQIAAQIIPKCMLEFYGK